MSSASTLFAEFIWEAVEKETGRARKPEAVIASLRRLRLVIKDAVPGSALFDVVTREKIEGLASNIEQSKPTNWTPDVQKAIADLVALNEKRSSIPGTGGDASAPQGPPGTVLLLMGTHPKCSASPIYKLKDQRHVFRTIHEFVVMVPFKKRWRVGRQLGEGGHSTVRKCTHLYRFHGKVMAVKSIHERLASEFEMEMMRKEAAIMRKLHHPHIPTVYDHVEEGNEAFLVLPMYEGGDMLERLCTKAGHRFSEAVVIKLLKDVTKTLAYLHAAGIAHRDVKPENIIFESKSDTSAMYLIDFGFSASGVVGQSLTTACGTPQYAAPEILNGMPHGKEVDLWSLGVVVYVLLCGFPPFYDDDEHEMFRIIKRGEFEFPSPSWDPISANAKDFIGRLLVLDPDQRMTAKQALAHPWLSGKNASRVHLSMVQQEAKKFRSRSQWNMKVSSFVDPESFAIKSMRLAQSTGTAEPDAELGTQQDLGADDESPEGGSPQSNANEVAEQDLLKQTIASGDTDEVIATMMKVVSTKSKRFLAVEKESNEELVKLRKIVNNQRCEISNLQMENVDLKAELAQLKMQLQTGALIQATGAGSGLISESGSGSGLKKKKGVSFGADTTFDEPSSTPEPSPPPAPAESHRVAPSSWRISTENPEVSCPYLLWKTSFKCLTAYMWMLGGEWLEGERECSGQCFRC